MKGFKVILAAAVLAVFAAGCESGQPKATAVANEGAGLEGAARAQLQAIKPIPFGYKSAALPLKDPKYTVAGVDVDTFMKATVIPALASIANSLPASKKIVVNGQANQVGPEQAVAGKKGNVRLSQERANAVLNYIVANSKIGKDKIVAKGNGSSRPLSGADPKDIENARVDFDIE